MLRSISSSDLRVQIGQVLNEVGYGQAQYIVERSGQPTAAIISIQDFHFLQAMQERQATTSLQETLAGIRARNRALDPGELDALVEEARAEFYDLKRGQADVR